MDGFNYLLHFKKVSRFLFFTAIAFVIGCSTTVIKPDQKKYYYPPNDADLKKIDIDKLDSVSKFPPNIYWWSRYRLAQLNETKDTKLACEIYRNLGEDLGFPLRKLATLNAFFICTDKVDLNFEIKPDEPFYDKYVDARLIRAKKENNIQDQIKFLREKSRNEIIAKIKEDLLLEAIDLAQKNNLQQDEDEAKAQLYRMAPRYKPSPTADEYFAVANNHRQSRNFSKAIAIYNQILKNKSISQEDYYSTLRSIRATYKVAQQKEMVLKTNEVLSKWIKQQYKKNKQDPTLLKKLLDSQIQYARDAWTQSDVKKAESILSNLIKILKDKTSLEEVYFLLGRIKEEDKNYSLAVEYYEKSLKEKEVNGLETKILWYLGWIEYKDSKFAEAFEKFKLLNEKSTEQNEQFKAQFWMAMAKKNLNSFDEYQNLLLEIIQKDPIGYYGVIASRELKIPFKPFAQEAHDQSNKRLYDVSAIPEEKSLLIEWLISCREYKSSEKYLQKTYSDLVKAPSLPEQDLLVIFSSFARAQLYLPLFGLVNNLTPDMKSQFLKNHPDILFPQPFTELYKDVSQKYEVPFELMSSITRQESAFNPFARSSADAMGLMQLLPSVARAVAKKNHLLFEKAEDLFDPKINVPLASLELKSLLKKYDEKYILSIANYNANESAIKTWLTVRYRGNPIEFIEEIPYEETKTYVKLVLRNYIFYMKENSKEEFLFPEKLLKWD